MTESFSLPQRDSLCLFFLILQGIWLPFAMIIVILEYMCIINAWKFECVKDKILKNKLINAFDFNNPSFYRWFLVALETLKLREMTTSSLTLLRIFVVTWCSLLYEKKYGKHPQQRFPWFFSPKQRKLAIKVNRDLQTESIVNRDRITYCLLYSHICFIGWFILQLIRWYDVQNLERSNIVIDWLRKCDNRNFITLNEFSTF